MSGGEVDEERLEPLAGPVIVDVRRDGSIASPRVREVSSTLDVVPREADVAPGELLHVDEVAVVEVAIASVDPQHAGLLIRVGRAAAPVSTRAKEEVAVLVDVAAVAPTQRVSSTMRTGESSFALAIATVAPAKYSTPSQLVDMIGQMT